MPNDEPDDPTHYEILGIALDASDEEIRAAHRKRVWEWHTDRHRGRSKHVQDEFNVLMQRANVAREVLLNPRSRIRYDHEQRTKPGAKGTANNQRKRERTRQRERQQRERERQERERQQQEREQQERERQQRERERQERERQQQEREQRERERQRREQQRNPDKLWADFDFYQLLGVPKDASDEAIKAAANQRLKEWHPDLHRGQSREIYDYFARLTTAVNAAKEVLLNPRLRREYNEFRETHDPRQQGDDDLEQQQQRDRERQQQRQREQEERQRREQQERKRQREYERQQREQERQRAQRKQEREQREREEYERLQHEREQREQREQERKRQREYERQQRERERQRAQQTREREQREREQQRARETEYGRQPVGSATARTPSRPTAKTRSAATVTPSSAATIGYVILALLALAAAGAVIYGLVVAIPIVIEFIVQIITNIVDAIVQLVRAVVNFLIQLVIWVFGIALIIGTCLLAAKATAKD